MRELVGEHQLVHLEVFLAACVRTEMMTLSHLQFLLEEDLTNSLAHSVSQ